MALHKETFALCTLEDEGNKIVTDCQELLTQRRGFNAKTLEFLCKVYCKDFSLWHIFAEKLGN